MAEILSGKHMSEQLTEEQIQRVRQMRSEGFTPGLAVVLVGDHPASQIYVRNKERACKQIDCILRWCG